jgi:hypothetical protein
VRSSSFSYTLIEDIRAIVEASGKYSIGTPVRALPFGDMRAIAFAKLANSERPGDRQLYEANKERIVNGRLILSDDEARTLQTAAMRSQRKWSALLQSNLQSEEAFATTIQEIERIQGEMVKLKDNAYSVAVFLESDKQFAARIAD